MNQIDLFDVIAAVGVLLVAVGLYLGLGLAPALAFVGIVFLAVGIAGGEMLSRRRRG